MQNSLKTFLQRTSGLLTSAGADVVRWQIYLFPVHLQRQGIKGRGSRKEGGGGGGEVVLPYHLLTSNRRWAPASTQYFDCRKRVYL